MDAKLEKDAVISLVNKSLEEEYAFFFDEAPAAREFKIRCERAIGAADLDRVKKVRGRGRSEATSVGILLGSLPNNTLCDKLTPLTRRFTPRPTLIAEAETSQASHQESIDSFRHGGKTKQGDC